MNAIIPSSAIISFGVSNVHNTHSERSEQSHTEVKRETCINSKSSFYKGVQEKVLSRAVSPRV